MWRGGGGRARGGSWPRPPPPGPGPGRRPAGGGAARGSPSGADWLKAARGSVPAIAAQDLVARLENAALGGNVHTAREILPSLEREMTRLLRALPDPVLLLDHDGAAAGAWGARALPSSVIVGPDGTIRYSHVGAFDWSTPEVRRSITGLMRKLPPLRTAWHPSRSG